MVWKKRMGRLTKNISIKASFYKSRVYLKMELIIFNFILFYEVCEYFWIEKEKNVQFLFIFINFKVS